MPDMAASVFHTVVDRYMASTYLSIGGLIGQNAEFSLFRPRS